MTPGCAFGGDGPIRQPLEVKTRRSTGTDVEVVRVIEDDATVTYETICWGHVLHFDNGRTSEPTHNGVCEHHDAVTARAWAAHPEDWCEECMAQEQP